MLFIGCAQKIHPVASLVDQNTVKGMKLNHGTARVHFYAGWTEMYGKKNYLKNTDYAFFIEGEKVGDIFQPDEFVAVDLYPGRYVCTWLPLSHNGQWYSEKLTITIKEAELVFLEANVNLEHPGFGLLGGGLLTAFNHKFRTSLVKKHKAGQQSIMNKKLVSLNTHIKDNIIPISGTIKSNEQ
jgi:hypothetical protein